MRTQPGIAAACRAMFALLLGLVSPSAFAYLDPSTGSMIVSAIIGIFASIALALKTYWYKLKALFRRKDASGSGAGEDKAGDTTRDT